MMDILEEILGGNGRLLLGVALGKWSALSRQKRKKNDVRRREETPQLWVAQKRGFLVFFQFLVYRREMEDEKREIDFLHFLPIFGQILVIFDDFL